MSIQHAILGFLNWRPASGYDLKKLFADDPTHYWSGNNNQIYRALLQLHAAGMVTREIEQQEFLPARKVYAITDKGVSELRKWVLSTPELPQLRHSFLVQLAWADLLDSQEIDHLLLQYAAEINSELVMLQEMRRRGRTTPARTPREVLLWEAILENRISFFEQELTWCAETREKIRSS